MWETVQEVLSDVRDGYNDAVSRGDHRTAGLPLIDSPLPTILICCCYYIVCINARKFSPARPYELKYTMAAYNLIMVAVSGWMFYVFAVDGWLGPYFWQIRCPPFYPSRRINYTPAQDRRIVLASLLYYYTKYIEFLDTVFFMLRHKFHQMSYLHMVHHGLMPWGIYYQVKWFPTGAGTFIAFLNSGIHSIMYLYYGLAALGLQRYLSFWKRYMTRMQMAQFVAIFCYYNYLWLIEEKFFSCQKVPTVICALAAFSATVVFVFFANFYITSYLAELHQQRKQREKQRLSQAGIELQTTIKEKIVNGHAHHQKNSDNENDDEKEENRRPRRRQFPNICR